MSFQPVRGSDKMRPLKSNGFTSPMSSYPTAISCLAFLSYLFNPQKCWRLIRSFHQTRLCVACIQYSSYIQKSSLAQARAFYESFIHQLLSCVTFWNAGMKLLALRSSTGTYRVTNQVQVEPNLPLTSKQKLRFSLSRSGQARLKRNFCFDVKGRFGST